MLFHRAFPEPQLQLQLTLRATSYSGPTSVIKEGVFTELDTLMAAGLLELYLTVNLSNACGQSVRCIGYLTTFCRAGFASQNNFFNICKYYNNNKIELLVTWVICTKLCTKKP